MCQRERMLLVPTDTRSSWLLHHVCSWGAQYALHAMVIFETLFFVLSAVDLWQAPTAAESATLAGVGSANALLQAQRDTYLAATAIFRWAAPGSCTVGVQCLRPAVVSAITSVAGVLEVDRTRPVAHGTTLHACDRRVWLCTVLCLCRTPCRLCAYKFGRLRTVSSLSWRRG
jgi:hypothetical protein